MQQYTKFMRRACRFTAAALALGAGVGMMSLAGSASAQTAAAGAAAASKKVSLNLVNQPIQTALRLLFNSEGINNSIDQDVMGTVSINVNDVSFDVALKALLNAANPPLTYDVNNNIYHVSVKREAPPQYPQQAAPTPAAAADATQFFSIPINQYDAGMIAQLIANSGNGGIIIVPPNYPVSSSQGGQGGQSGFGGMSQMGGFGGGMSQMGGGMMGGGMMGGGMMGGGMMGGGMMGGGTSFGGGGFGGRGGF